MNIRTHTVKNQALVAPRSGFTPTARLDQELAPGQVDRTDLGRDRYRNDQVAASKSSVLRRFATEGIAFSALGTLGGLALTNFHPVGAAVGAGLGAYLAWNKTLRPDSGKVEVRIDDQVHQSRYYKDPQAEGASQFSYPRVPGQLRTEMMIDGRLGEKIELANPRNEDLSSLSLPEVPSQLKSHLKGLSEQNKIVADLGQKSRYGYEVLSPVDARTAAKLMANGQEVFSVSGQVKDTTHTLKVTAANERSTSRSAQSGAYVERQFDYKLSPLSLDTNEDTNTSGQGLPEGFAGVYKNLESCSLVVGSDEQLGFGTNDTDTASNHFSSSRIQRDLKLDLGATDQARIRSTSAINVRDLVTMGGVLAGMVTATSLAPGVSEVVLIGAIVGGVAGRELGWKAQDLMPTFGSSK